MTKLSRILGLLLVNGWLWELIAIPHAWAQNTSDQPSPFVIQIDPKATHPQEFLTGAPQTRTMESGYVALPPLRSVGAHNTQSYEEIVLVFSGRGELRLGGGATLPLTPNSLAYCPPFTEHNVVNTGGDTLRYIWLAAKAIVRK
ncbi:MAG TPA: cupin domain-containing protein [Bacteroidota bacterium]|nr:cupin domain-containing protein [Bacteroidota bacterium]